MHVSFEKDPLAELMVKEQLRTRGITDEKICAIMERLPRWLFVSGVSKEKTYGDHPVSIGHGQTISQPYMVAFMTQLLEIGESERVLEIGTGSGYQTAILAELGAFVYTVERIDSLITRAERLLKNIGYLNIAFISADGSEGWEKDAPYDKIMVTAAAPLIPEKLKQQLADNGKMVIPIGDYRTYQVLNVITRIGRSFSIEESIGCRFVPLVGKDAFQVNP
jgi:protein-L-isoaspartate(D-aspartate) O-methyltransferase